MHSVFAIIISSLSLTAAHFTLDYPPTRGFSESTEPTSPCGGFNIVGTNRTAYPVKGGSLQINSRHAAAEVQVITSADGVTFASSPVETFSMTGLGTLCLKVPLSGYSAGDNVTMQVVFRANGENNLYQCADLTLTDAAPGPAASQCTNGTNVAVSNVRAAQQAGASGSASVGPSAAASSARSSGAASATAAASAARSSAASAAAYPSLGISTGSNMALFATALFAAAGFLATL